MTSITFNVPDMTCGHCEKAVRGALGSALPGAEVSVDLPAHKVTVAGDGETARAALIEAGFTPEPA